MHHCLSILELVENVCEHLEGVDQGRRTLAALARTCKSFHGPALNCLWAVQRDGMVNLMRCMPPDLFEFKDHGEIRLLRPILAADWERPLVHMRRIRRLHCLVPMPAAVFALCGSLPGDTGSLFPKLTFLHWSHSWRNGDSPSIEIFLSPKLTSLSISARLSETMLSAIPRTCPALKNLDMYGIYHDINFDHPSALSSCLRDLTSLESVEIVIPDLAALKHLSQLSGLASLTAGLPPNLPLPSIPLPFVALKTLVIRYDIEQVIRFLQRCSGVHLEYIIIELDPCPTTAAIARLHTALREGCSHTSLLSLAIDIEDDPPDLGDDAHGGIDIQSFRVLFCFVNITSISVTSRIGFNIDDQGLKELALAWPQIGELRLQLEPYDTDIRLHPLFSLRCLSMLAEHCRVLTVLEITLDATVIPEPDMNIRRQSALRNFDVGKSPIASPTLPVTRVISALFPSLSELTTSLSDCNSSNYDPDELAQAIVYHQLWMEVADQLPTLVAIRQEERFWAHEELGTQ
ncbi:hypothetical protein C8R45DRAFT_1212846 [Mycena sanguinolenta]|nr:hypothetical protein C8R45DRAFT_1212846 [Mycena sanguinolenta]